MFTPPTRGEKITWITFYALITLQGLAVLLIPPKMIEGPLSTTYRTRQPMMRLRYVK